MFKIILWRLIYHLLCLLKALGYRGTSVHYFAFGANLDPEVLKRRHIKTSARREYLLKDFELRFNHEIPFAGAAMASIEPSPGSAVPGIIYTISRIDELRLDCMESHIVFNRYAKYKVQDASQENTFFFYKTNCPQTGLKPTKAYLDKLLNGYQLVSHASPDFLKSLASVATIEGFSPKDPPEFLVKNYDTFTPLFRKWLMSYDKLCVKVFASLIFKPSFIERFFR